jgi:hypothetical protein
VILLLARVLIIAQAGLGCWLLLSRGRASRWWFTAACAISLLEAIMLLCLADWPQAGIEAVASTISLRVSLGRRLFRGKAGTGTHRVV